MQPTQGNFTEEDFTLDRDHIQNLINQHFDEEKITQLLTDKGYSPAVISKVISDLDSYSKPGPSDDTKVD